MRRAYSTVAAGLAGFALVAQAEHAMPSAIAEAIEKRRSAIARAKVWQPTDIASKNLWVGQRGPGAFAPGAIVSCDYDDETLSGRSPKFACRLSDGDVVKVKYGETNGEVLGEVAASRLLWALGFGADHMYPVTVICRGCPTVIGGELRPNGDRVVTSAVIERHMSGEKLAEEWSWRELANVDAAAGGATQAERDAFKLLAVFLQHTDSKPVQQRLMCVDERADEDEVCATPVVMIQDLGLTFGYANPFNAQPLGSMHLEAWSALPVWRTPTGCVGNLSDSVTGTLFHPQISEEGRRFLADLLSKLSDKQLRDMFAAARVERRLRNPRDPASGFATVDEWVDAFKKKRAEIVDRRCET